MTSFYEASTSGLNFDRFTDELFGESTRLRMKQAYWTAKQLLRQKMGKREDEHVEAADAELDMQLQRFKRIQEHTRRLLDLFSQLYREHVNLAQCEIDFADLLSDCEEEKAHLKRVLHMTANSQALAAKERQKMLRPIVRFYHELDEFYERAILDCEQTVEAVERARLDYRGSLLWMKKCSETLDPEEKNSRDSTNVEDFRTVQTVVKANKHRLDHLKLDVENKVDLLHRALKQLLRECLMEYKQGLVYFYQATAAEFGACAEQMAGLESYEIDVLKILEDPIGLAMEKQREEREKQRGRKGSGSGTMEGQRGSPNKAIQSSGQQQRRRQRQKQQFKEEREESLIELKDVEEAAEVTEPVMDRIRALLHFDDDAENLAKGREMPLLHDSKEGGGDNELLTFQQDDHPSTFITTTSSSGSHHGLNLLKHSNDVFEFGLDLEWSGKPNEITDQKKKNRSSNIVEENSNRPTTDRIVGEQTVQANSAENDDIFGQIKLTTTIGDAQQMLLRERVESESPLAEILVAVDDDAKMNAKLVEDEDEDEWLQNCPTNGRTSSTNAKTEFEDILLTTGFRKDNHASKMLSTDTCKQIGGKKEMMKVAAGQPIVDYEGAVDATTMVPRLQPPPAGQQVSRPVGRSGGGGGAGGNKDTEVIPASNDNGDDLILDQLGDLFDNDDKQLYGM